MSFKKAVLLLILFSVSLANAQDQDEEKEEEGPPTPWHRGGTFNVNFSQVALQHWAGGGQNSISGTSVMNLFADLRKERYTWRNSIDMAYGLLSQDKSPFIKNDDQIELNSRLGRRIKESDISYSSMLNFRSQFAPGYEFPEEDSIKFSNFLSPAYIKAATGFSYDPGESFDLSLSPAATKVTIVSDQDLADQGAFGVEPGKNVRYEFGGNLSASYAKEILPRTRLRSELSLFSNYLEKPGNIDINFSLRLNMKVNDFITANITTDMIYDDDIDIPVDTDDDGVPEKHGPRLQIKEVLNVGLSFNFGHEAQ